ncbi:YciI family protein [Nocardioides sp.]|uniref:YciI family protein n=1 Tax=Nocardioides sp. TaxID=35761 RepID=UPI0027325484|nr:YciI family protein [Nocardioides sp.]MDP3890282.1 YciI family protein [Nocardioides sp.]
MKFLLLSYTPAEAWDADTADVPSEEAMAAFEQYQRFEAQLRETGEFVLSEGLGHPAATTTVRSADTGVLVTDGPFAELKEVLASFAIIECSGIERAREIVAGMVAVLGEPMEIRPIMGDDFA